MSQKNLTQSIKHTERHTQKESMCGEQVFLKAGAKNISFSSWLQFRRRPIPAIFLFLLYKGVLF